jgi:acrylyl-CoA reductase (NADPH)
VRKEAWARLAHDLSPAKLEQIGAREIGLAEAIQAGRDILAGQIRGRVVVDVNR